MKKYALAVFDLAGTTVTDTNTVGACLQEAFQNAGITVSVDDVNSVMGITKPEAVKMLLERFQIEADADAIHEDYRNRMIASYQTSEDLGEIEGTSEVFQFLRDNGIRICLNTGFDRLTTNVLLSRMPWEGLVDDSITSDEVPHGRPHPDMILELCRRAGVEPSQVLKVGDAPADIQEGKNAGAGLVVGVLYGTHNRAQLEPFEPDMLIEDIRELLTLELEG
jgi:phosphonatase-like hydrolase